jgi:arylsulfatase A-like enzyme
MAKEAAAARAKSRSSLGCSTIPASRVERPILAGLPNLRTFGRSCCALCLLLLVACARPASRVRDWNLLIVTIDTLRADHVGCYGHAAPTTPRLDELAAQALRFEQAFTVMPTTLPAHAALFTSRYPSQLSLRANGERLAPSIHTLAERLRAAGFATGAFVSAVPLHPEFGLDQGFATYDHPQGPERSGDKTTTRALDWLARHKTQRFFCFVHLYDPHTWYTAPGEFRARFGAGAGQAPPLREYLPPATALDAAARRDARAAYQAEIAFADAQLGRLLDFLTAAELDGRTLVLVTSDHGETLDELIDEAGYAWDHGEFLHERELRVPLVMRAPGGPSGVVRENVSLIDLMPTLLELLALEPGIDLAGRSLAGLFAGRPLAEAPCFAERRRLTPEEIARPPHAWLLGEERAVIARNRLLLLPSSRPAELWDRASQAQVHEPETSAKLARLLELWGRQLEAGGLGVGGNGPSAELAAQLRELGYAAGGE